MLTEGDFIQAQQNPQLRKEFVSELDWSEIKDWTKSVVYCEKQDYLFDGEVSMLTKISLIPRVLNIKGKKSKIIIYPASFYNSSSRVDSLIHKNFGDFLSTLIDHEGTHAKQFYFQERKKLNLLHLLRKHKWVNLEIYVALNVLEAEFPAWENQTNNFSRRGSSSDFAQGVMRRKDSARGFYERNKYLLEQFK